MSVTIVKDRYVIGAAIVCSREPWGIGHIRGIGRTIVVGAESMAKQRRRQEPIPSARPLDGETHGHIPGLAF